MMNNNEENFNEEINLQNYKHDDSVDLDGVWLGNLMNMMKINYYFWVICNILSLLNLSNLNVYVMNTC